MSQQENIAEREKGGVTKTNPAQNRQVYSSELYANKTENIWKNLMDGYANLTHENWLGIGTWLQSSRPTPY